MCVIRHLCKCANLSPQHMSASRVCTASDCGMYTGTSSAMRASRELGYFARVHGSCNTRTKPGS